MNMNMTDKQLQSAQNISRSAFAFGAAATVFVNYSYAHSSVGAKIVSLIAPISILFVVEIITRIPISKGIRYGVASVVGSAALLTSYYHTAQLFISYGENPVIAWIQPIVPDGLMILATLSLIFLSNIEEKLDEAASKKKIALQKKSEAGPTKAQLATKAEQEAARKVYTDSVNDGKPFTPKELAEKTGRSVTWCRARIAEAAPSKELASA